MHLIEINETNTIHQKNTITPDVSQPADHYSSNVFPYCSLGVPNFILLFRVPKRTIQHPSTVQVITIGFSLQPNDVGSAAQVLSSPRPRARIKIRNYVRHSTMLFLFFRWKIERRRV